MALDGRYTPGTEVKALCNEGSVVQGEDNRPGLIRKDCDAQGNWIGTRRRCIGDTFRLFYFRRFVFCHHSAKASDHLIYKSPSLFSCINET